MKPVLLFLVTLILLYFLLASLKGIISDVAPADVTCKVVKDFNSVTIVCPPIN